MKRLSLLVASLALVAVPACSDPAPSSEDDGAAVVTTAPMLGVPGGQDGADQSCSVVLRSVARVPGNGGGYETNCIAGSSCWYVWEGVLDVSTEAFDLGASPVVLFQSGSDETWWKVEAEPMEASEGQHLYKFRIDEHTVPALGLNDAPCRSVTWPSTGPQRVPFLIGADRRKGAVVERSA